MGMFEASDVVVGDDIYFTDKEYYSEGHKVLLVRRGGKYILRHPLSFHEHGTGLTPEPLFGPFDALEAAEMVRSLLCEEVRV